MNWSLTNILLLIFCILICNLAGFPGEIFTISRQSDWYVHLKKPAFHPPTWLYAPILVTLYTLFGISLFIVLNHGTSKQYIAIALFYFVLLLIFNSLWSMIFLGFRSFSGGLITKIILCIITAITIYDFYSISKLASIILLPYFLWIVYTAIVNFNMWQLNKPHLHTPEPSR